MLLSVILHFQFELKKKFWSALGFDPWSAGCMTTQQTTRVRIISAVTNKVINTSSIIFYARLLSSVRYYVGHLGLEFHNDHVPAAIPNPANWPQKTWAFPYGLRAREWAFLSEILEKEKKPITVENRT